MRAGKTAGARALPRLGVVCLATLASACGGDDSPKRPDTARDEAAVRRVLEGALHALYEGDGRRACNLYTSAYRRELVAENQAHPGGFAPKGRTCEEQVKSFASVLRRFVPRGGVRVLSVRVDGDEATAVSEFKTTRGKTRVKEFLVRRAGVWRIDHDQEPGEPPGRPRR